MLAFLLSSVIADAILGRLWEQAYSSSTETREVLGAAALRWPLKSAN